MNARNFLSIFTMFVATCTAGCYSTWDLSPEMVWKLDGFDGKSPKKLKVLEELVPKEVTFTSDTYLQFRPQQGPEVRARFRSLELKGPVLVGIEKDSGDQLNVDLRQMKLVQVSELSVEKTAGATVGFIGSLVPLGFGILYGLVFTFSFGGE